MLPKKPIFAICLTLFLTPILFFIFYFLSSIFLSAHNRPLAVENLESFEGPLVAASSEKSGSWIDFFGEVVGKVLGTTEKTEETSALEIVEPQAHPFFPEDLPLEQPQVLGEKDETTSLVQQLTAFSPQASLPINSNNLKTTAVNLLRNSSFEEESGGAPRQWVYNLDGSSARVFRSNEAYRSGNYSLKFQGGDTGNFGISQTLVKTLKRRAYTLSAWVKATNVPSNASFKLTFWDEVGNKRASSKSFTLSGTREWQRIKTNINNSNGWEGKKWYPMIEVNGLTSGSVYLDDIQLEEGIQLSLYHFGGGGGSTEDTATGIGDGSVLVGTDGSLYPAIPDTGSLGIGTARFRELRLSKASIDNNGNMNLDGSLTVQGRGYFKENLDVSGAATIGGNLRVDGATTLNGNLTVNGTTTFNGHLLPGADDTYDLGSSTAEWRNLYVDGIGYIDAITLVNNETITNATDDNVVFTGAGGTDNTDLTLDLDGTYPVLSSAADTQVGIDEDLIFVGAPRQLLPRPAI